MINNAGFELTGAVEELSLDEVWMQFETNLFGVIRMVNQLLPFMRQQKQGRIINAGSLSGLRSRSIYSASKFALEGYTECLRQELKPFDIHVSLTEPGFLKTTMMNNRRMAGALITKYDPWRPLTSFPHHSDWYFNI